jgi:hypothetical protein
VVGAVPATVIALNENLYGAATLVTLGLAAMVLIAYLDRRR